MARVASSSAVAPNEWVCGTRIRIGLSTCLQRANASFAARRAQRRRNGVIRGAQSQVRAPAARWKARQRCQEVTRTPRIRVTGAGNFRLSEIAAARRRRPTRSGHEIPWQGTSAGCRGGGGQAPVIVVHAPRLRGGGGQVVLRVAQHDHRIVVASDGGPPPAIAASAARPISEHLRKLPVRFLRMTASSRSSPSRRGYRSIRVPPIDDQVSNDPARRKVL